MLTKLTIGIPTFNSVEYLRHTLEEALAQIANQEGIEVLICDNASDDGTESLVNGYMKKFPRLEVGSEGV